jgi:rod shape-determining protein MreC
MSTENQHTERKIIILAAVLFFHLILVSTNVVLENDRSLFQNIVGNIISPIQIAFQESVDWISHQMRHYVFLKNSFVKYHDLKKKYIQLKRENYLLKKRMDEKNFLDYVKKKRSEFIKADVISFDRNFPFTNISINKGSNNGIARDMIVLNGEGELVGKIVEPISFFSATVRLVTSSVGGIGAYIEPDRLEGLLTGNNTTICSFRYLIEKKNVKIGDQVVTSGTDEIFPVNLPIGRVVDVRKDLLIQEIDVEPFFTKRTLKQLIVVSNDERIETPDAGKPENTEETIKKK